MSTRWMFKLEVTDEEDEGCEELAGMVEAALLELLPSGVQFQLMEDEEEN